MNSVDDLYIGKGEAYYSVHRFFRAACIHHIGPFEGITFLACLKMLSCSLSIGAKSPLWNPVGFKADTAQLS